MSFYKTLCVNQPSRFKITDNLRLNETQYKYLAILNKIFPIITLILEKTYSKNNSAEKAKLLEKPYQDLLDIYNSIFKFDSLSFISDYHPDIWLSIIEINPDEYSDWIDYYHEEIVDFKNLIYKLNENNKTTISKDINNLIKRTNELLESTDNSPWKLFNTTLKTNLETYKKHWLKGLIFYYKKDNGEIISLTFEKSVKNKSLINYEFFRIFYETYKKDKKKLLSGKEVMEIINKKTKTKSEFNDLKANFNKKIKDTDLADFVQIIFDGDGYRLKIRE